MKKPTIAVALAAGLTLLGAGGAFAGGNTTDVGVVHHRWFGQQCKGVVVTSNSDSMDHYYGVLNDAPNADGQLPPIGAPVVVGLGNDISASCQAQNAPVLQLKYLFQ